MWNVSRSEPRPRVGLVLVAVAAPAVLAGCAADAPSEAAASAARELRVIGGPEGAEYGFVPATIASHVGETLRVEFRNAGKLEHTFGVPDLGVDTGVVPPGGTGSVELRPPRAGVLQITCAIPGHVELGMVGRLEVAA